MIQICRICKRNRAQPTGAGTPFCSVCRHEADAFLGRFSRGESIEDRADWIAFGLIATGLTVAMALAAFWLAKDGYGSIWWAL